MSRLPLLARRWLAALLLSVPLAQATDALPGTNDTSLDYYLPAADDRDPAIPTPEQFLGYPIGSRYTRHDQLVAYLKELDRLSDRVSVAEIGRTYEERALLLVTITSPRNQARIDTIKAQRAQLVDPAQPAPATSDAPVAVWLAYSVHGNESSSGEAVLLTAYQLAASRSDATRQLLDNAVVLIDPAQNPDGRDRAANWHNAYASTQPSTDPADKAHVEPFPNGRTNHYFTDLNRDWLALTQRDSRPKVEAFHQWYPNVQIDFHEMGGASTYYFEPSPASMHSPLLPAASYEFNKVLAKHHAKALDALGSLYYTGENFDNFSPVYGSTYPDFHGAVGVTVEQASSRGLALDTPNGVLSFPFTIRNQVAVGLETVRGAVAEHAGLFGLQKEFYRSALTQAAKNPFQSYVFGDGDDPVLTRQLLDLLLRHRIQVHALDRDISLDGQNFHAGQAYVVSARQPQFRLAHSIFEDTPKVKGDVFYGSTSYAIAPAYGLPFATSKSLIAAGSRIDTLPASRGALIGGTARYAYAASWRNSNATQALNRLLEKGIKVRSAFKPFSSRSAQGEQSFGYGALVIPVAGQTLSADALQAAISDVAASSGVDFHSLASGQSSSGIDLGSDFVKPVRQPKVALLLGEGVNATEIGSTWFSLSEHVRTTPTLLDPGQLGSVPLQDYTSIVIAGGNYARIGAPAIEALKAWIQAGGSLITFGSASQWAIDSKLASEQLVPAEGEKPAQAAAEPADKPSPKAPASERLDFDNQREVSAVSRVSGNIVSADIDVSHPLGFGVARRALSINKESGLALQPSKNAYSTVVRIDAKPHVNGYLSDANRQRIAGSAWLLVSPQGSGNVVLFADDPFHRKYWHATERVLLNAIFLGNHLNPARERR